MTTFPQDLSTFDEIIFHFDGNNNDPDDIAAIPMAALIANAANLEDKTTFFYGNNLSEPSLDSRVKPLSKSADFAEKLGITTYSYQDGLNRATNELVKILDSGKKVLAIEGGPMEAIYRAVARTKPQNRGNITLISHGTWNEVRDVGTRPGGGKPRTWDDLRKDFPQLELIQIKDQNNGVHNGKGFYNHKWDWLDSTNNPIFQEARRAMRNAGGNKADDPSDSGMLFYAVTGQQDGTPGQVRKFFEKNPPTLPNSRPIAPVLAAQPSADGVFQMQNGTLMMEAESAKAVGDWDVTKIDGETSLLWDPASSSIKQVPKGQTLTYEFETDAAGSYGIGLHSGRVKAAMTAEDLYKNGKNGTQRTDTGNDVFVSVVNAETGKVVQSPTKLYTVLGSSDKTLKWGTNFDANHKQSPARVKLQGNTRYRLEVSGRADGYALDRITLSKNGFLTNENIPQSPIKQENEAPTPQPAAPSRPDSEADLIEVPVTNGNDGPLLTIGLADAATDQIVTGFEDLGANSTINLNNLDLTQYTLVAQVNPDHAGAVKSIKFDSPMASRTENAIPYALFGDQRGDFAGQSLANGNYSIKATAYSKSQGKGTNLGQISLDYSVVGAQEPPAAQLPEPTPPKSIPSPPIVSPAPQPEPISEADAIPAPGNTDALITIGLADATTNQMVAGFENLATNNTIDLSTLDFTQYTLVAQVNPDHGDAGAVKSIKFASDVANRTENAKPYALFGDQKGDFAGKLFETGDYSIKATAYSQSRGRGTALEQIDLDYSVVVSGGTTGLGANPAPSSPAPGANFGVNKPLLTFALANADTNQIVTGFENLSPNGTINLNAVNLSEYSLIAQVNPDHPDADAVESIKFASTLGSRTENVVPYALFGDTDGDLFGQPLNSGNYSVTATAYSKDKGKGNVLGRQNLTYAVTNSVDNGAALSSMDSLLRTDDTKAPGDRLATKTATASELLFSETFSDANARPGMPDIFTPQTGGSLLTNTGQSLSGASGLDLLGHHGTMVDGDAMTSAKPEKMYGQPLQGSFL